MTTNRKNSGLALYGLHGRCAVRTEKNGTFRVNCIIEEGIAQHVNWTVNSNNYDSDITSHLVTGAIFFFILFRSSKYRPKAKNPVQSHAVGSAAAASM